jgi:uncharacterized protein YjbJ (UPF0337 family)
MRRQVEKETPMSNQDSGPEAAVKGAVEGAKGKIKEVAGAVTGRDDLQREGEAQQEKADSQREVATKEAEAEKARAEAAVHEAEQKAHQN